MAEGTSVRQDDVVCRYFYFSNCRDGDSCLFSHDSTRRTPDSVCRYYIQGTCRYGHHCRYDHVIKENYSRSYNERYCAESSRRSANREIPGNFDTNRNFRYPGFASFKNEGTETSVRSSSSNKLPDFKRMPSAESSQNFMMDERATGLQCPYNQRDVCKLCRDCLHPTDEKQRKLHIEQCEELAAIHRSRNKTCGICMDVVLKKKLSERTFGILEKCSHVYCLTCIKKWRRSKLEEIDLDSDVTRACPQCRTTSDFVMPSNYFVEAGEEKEKLITEYKKALSEKHCKYFKDGKGTCPFGGACLYLHAKPDGTKVELPSPPQWEQLNLRRAPNSSIYNFLISHLERGLDLGDWLFIGSDSDDDSDTDISSISEF